MKVNGEAIYGTTASPFQQLPWGRCTKKVGDGGARSTCTSSTGPPRRLEGPADGKLLVHGLKNKAEEAYLLADAERKALATESSPRGLVISVPAAVRMPFPPPLSWKFRARLWWTLSPPCRAKTAPSG